MRVLIAGFVVILTASAVFAQQPPAPASPAASRTMVSASDVTALIAKAKAERKDNQALLAQSMIQLAPYNVSLEYRAAVANAAVHETEAELFYVIDGSATLVTGGKLTNENRTNAANLSGTGNESFSLELLEVAPQRVRRETELVCHLVGGDRLRFLHRHEHVTADTAKAGECGGDGDHGPQRRDRGASRPADRARLDRAAVSR